MPPDHYWNVINQSQTKCGDHHAQDPTSQLYVCDFAINMLKEKPIRLIKVYTNVCEMQPTFL